MDWSPSELVVAALRSSGLRAGLAKANSPGSCAIVVDGGAPTGRVVVKAYELEVLM